MDFHFIKPAGFLKNHIRYYCFMESGIHEANVKERVIPTGNVQLMFHYKNPFVVFQPDSTLVKQPRSIISGLADSYTDVSTNGETGVVFISFYPLSACHFFNFPLADIENQSVDLRDVFNTGISNVEEKLYFKKTIAEKVTVIEEFLMKLYCPIPANDNLMIQKGLDFIKSTGGQANAAILSQKLSVNQKTLERKFSQYMGKTTKQIIKLIRFQQVLIDFSEHKNVSLTELAYRNGYFDQSHFIRDFKKFTGFTPKQFTSKYPDYSIYADACQE